MTRSIRLFLLGILLVLVSVEGTWLLFAHFDVNFASLGTVLVFASIPFLIGLFYSYVRSDERVAAMLFAMSFLLIFGPLCTNLNYFSVSIAGHRIDDFLARIDRVMGVDWPSLVLVAYRDPRILKVLGLAYSISTFQVAIPLILLGLNGDPKDISRLCIAVVFCALGTLAFWTIFPSFGAYTVYDWASIGRRAHVIVVTHYAEFLNSLFSRGIGRVDPTSERGLVGFPSFHSEEIVMGVWYIRTKPYFFVPLFIFSIVALISVPIEGGHHVVDVMGGLVFAAGGIWAASRTVDRLVTRDEVLEVRERIPAGA